MGMQNKTQRSAVTKWQNGVYDVLASAGQMPSAAGSTVSLIADASNADTVFIGNSVSNCTLPIAPGQFFSFPFANLDMIYAVASATGNSLHWEVD
jgi:hypothetical protein